MNNASRRMPTFDRPLLIHQNSITCNTLGNRCRIAAMKDIDEQKLVRVIAYL
jgi:hypothetical protein